MVPRMMRPFFGIFAVVLILAGVREVAIAQNDQNLRRAAFQNAKESQKLGEFADAVDVLEPLAEKGDELALYTIGILYETGAKDLPQDYAKALAYFQKGADKRHAGSMRQIAELYGKGLGVPADPNKAAQWYDDAATRGDALAQLTVGLMYVSGQGKGKSATQACKWLTLAAAGVFYDNELEKRTETKNALKTLVATMSPGDIAAGEKLTREFSAQ